mmetsp:Transcript_158983/g.486538  ORF Transcript_158983/g.486538 Transcript_158983/m.486538 type:complete len:221 (-) Transcript_158983:565-1227(-)
MGARRGQLGSGRPLRLRARQGQQPGEADRLLHGAPRALGGRQPLPRGGSHRRSWAGRPREGPAAAPGAPGPRGRGNPPAREPGRGARGPGGGRLDGREARPGLRAVVRAGQARGAESHRSPPCHHRAERRGSQCGLATLLHGICLRACSLRRGSQLGPAELEHGVRVEVLPSQPLSGLCTKSPCYAGGRGRAQAKAGAQIRACARVQNWAAMLDWRSRIV